jgi:uncharacterized membrane protein YdjX (TVP38/TMEM64 family)
MKKLFVKTGLLLVVGGMIYGILLQSHSTHASETVGRVLAPAHSFFATNPALAIALFCLAHLLASTLCIPGSCTFLNTLSGAIFGFWLGCTLVYPITIVSACLMYWVGRKLDRVSFIKSYKESIESWRKMLKSDETMYFVALRLSPVFPFGLLNVAMGLVHVPFTLYFMTTIVGIFFDVTLLNNLGAAVGTASPQSEKSLAISFFVLLLLLFLLRFALGKAYDQRPREQV